MKVLFLLLWALSLFASGPYVTSTMTMQELNKLTASDANASDNFGYSVAISGDTAIVGAVGDDTSGSAYIYLLNRNTGLFEQTAKLTTSDANDYGYFKSVAISGDTVIAGGGYYDGTSNVGFAYIFEKPEGGWVTTTETVKLTASDTTAESTFGQDVAISGDTVVVGAHGTYKNSHKSAGAAYIFEKPEGGWATATQTVKLTASLADDFDFFGYSVAMSGDTVVVGAHGEDDSVHYAGSAYIFEKPEGGWATATQTAKLTASDAPTDQHADEDFGRSVSISGDTVIVGANGHDGIGSNSGSAYIFEKPESGWATATETAKLTASDANASDHFGHSVAISGDTAIVGAHWDEDNAGAAYFFKKPESGWATATETAKLTASDANASDQFGQSVAVSGGTVIVGAPMDDDGGRSSGSAYIYKAKESPSALPAIIMYLLQ